MGAFIQHPRWNGISVSLRPATSIQHPASLRPANSICFSSTRRFEAKLRYNVLYLSILANSVNSLLIPLNSTSIHKQSESTAFFNLNKQGWWFRNKSDFPIFWIPGCAGITIRQLISDRYHRRHTRAGGHPFFKTTVYDFFSANFQPV